MFSIAGEDGKAEKIETEDLLADDIVQQTDRTTPNTTTNQPVTEAFKALGSSATDDADTDS